MRLNFIILLFSIAIVGCRTVKQSSTFEYQGENGQVEYFNIQKKTKPLVVVIPDVYNSLISKEHIEALAKNNRVVVIYYLANRDKIRLQQIDGLQNRSNYYSSVLTHVLNDEERPTTLISEGINATIAINLGLNFSQPELVLLNAWHPTMRQILTTNCYASATGNCDSLLNYLEFADRFEADKLLTALKEKGIDKQYGLFTVQIWEQFIDLNTEAFLINYKNNVRWIYTSNTGLPANAKAEVFTKKEFLKKTTVLSN